MGPKPDGLRQAESAFWRTIISLVLGGNVQAELKKYVLHVANIVEAGKQSPKEEQQHFLIGVFPERYRKRFLAPNNLLMEGEDGSGSDGEGTQFSVSESVSRAGSKRKGKQPAAPATPPTREKSTRNRNPVDRYVGGSSRSYGSRKRRRASDAQAPTGPGEPSSGDEEFLDERQQFMNSSLGYYQALVSIVLTW